MVTLEDRICIRLFTWSLYKFRTFSDGSRQDLIDKFWAIENVGIGETQHDL